MKKILSAVAAFGLVAGVASTAAAVDFSVTGRYVVEGYYLSDANGNGLVLQDGGDTVGSDAYFVHSLKMAPILKINDKVKLVTDIWLADNDVWGGVGGNETATQGSTALGTNDVEIWQAYLEYISPVGKFHVGRHLAGPFGTSFLDTVFKRDRIMWWPSMLASGPWSTLLKYQKSAENDGVDADGTVDRDNDYYELDVFHKTDKGLGFSRIGYTNNKANAVQDTQDWRVTVGGNYKLPAFYISTEIDYQFGETESAGNPDIDTDKLAAFLQVGTKMGALDVSGMYIYASGDDNGTTDNENSAVGALGNEFEPYYILTGSHAGIFNTEFATGAAINGAARTAGIHSIGVHANYAMSERLMLHGAVAYAMAADELAGYDDEFGIEYNVGAAYKLLDNLTYEAHFGFLDTGDFFNGTATSNTGTAESVYLVSNHLTMTF